MKKSELIYPELSFKINGLLFQVHNELGRFAREKQYADLFEHKLKSIGMPYEREKELIVITNGTAVKGNKADFIIDGKVLIELKAKPIITQTDYYQTLRYLNAAKLKLGMLVNFRRKYLHPKRILNSNFVL